MKRRLFCICFVVSIILCTSACSQKKVESPTLNDLKKNSDYFVYISAFSKYEVEEKDNKIYTKIGVLYTDYWQKKHIKNEITIVEENESFIDDGNVYLAFLSEIEGQPDCYSLTNGKSGLFEIEKGKIKPIDNDLKEEVKTYWDSDVDNIGKWASENYEEPSTTMAVQEYSRSNLSTSAVES